jgi:hypothetical protein
VLYSISGCYAVELYSFTVLGVLGFQEFRVLRFQGFRVKGLGLGVRGGFSPGTGSA